MTFFLDNIIDSQINLKTFQSAFSISSVSTSFNLAHLLLIKFSSSLLFLHVLFASFLLYDFSLQFPSKYSTKQLPGRTGRSKKPSAWGEMYEEEETRLVLSAIIHAQAATSGHEINFVFAACCG
jgi:hypothetical protein